MLTTQNAADLANPAAAKVSALYAKLATINEASILPVCRDRHIPRKEQATLARKLFKSLGLAGISVTTPNYSMASTVDVAIPSLPHESGDYLLAGVNYENNSYSDMPDAVPCKAKMLARSAATRKVQEILARAFPQHDDRSDSMTDYFDSCWSF